MDTESHIFRDSQSQSFVCPVSTLVGTRSHDIGDGAPREVLSDNSFAFNQLRQGRIGAVETFLASKGAMPISGLPGKPTTQGKNERSHQTLIRFLDANTPASLETVRALLRRFRDH